MNVQEHQQKFESSEALANEYIMEVDTTCHRDWLTIVLYYGALHLVHKHCANRKTPTHPTNHPAVLKEARNVKRGNKVYAELLNLYNASLDARYEAVFHTKEDLIELKKSYEIIKSVLL